MDNSQIPLKIKEILVRELHLPVRSERISESESLFSPAIWVDSLGLVRLIVALENEFDIEIDDADVVEVGLETVASLIELVRKKLVSEVDAPGR